jgi:dihydrofolate reductase
MTAELAIIAAMAKNRVIGANGSIPWRLPDELQLFKRVTMGRPIIMGRRTWDSIGRLLPGRRTVIITRQSGYTVSGAVIAHSLEDAVARCGEGVAFVTGGGELYAQALPLARQLHLTTIDIEPAGDTHMPEINMPEWREVHHEHHAADARNVHAWDYRAYVRR